MSKYFLVFLFLFGTHLVFSQDDLLALLEEQEVAEKEEVTAIFKGTRLVHGQTVKMRKKGELDFLISHRFGRINSGAFQLFGLDDAQMRIGLDYAILDRLMIGVGRSSFDKTYDGFVKFKALSQSSGPGAFPFSVVVVANTAIKTTPQAKFNPDISLVDRYSYTYSLLLARKFSSAFSAQIMPVFVHKNRVTAPEKNNTMALGAGFRIMITPSVSINTEYYHRIGVDEGVDAYNSLAIGFDIETGGHVFQLHLSNSRGMIERSFVTETEGDLSAGDIHFGFNISRTFNVGGKR